MADVIKDAPKPETAPELDIKELDKVTGGAKPHAEIPSPIPTPIPPIGVPPIPWP
jgi:hypothetical protein